MRYCLLISDKYNLAKINTCTKVEIKLLYPLNIYFCFPGEPELDQFSEEQITQLYELYQVVIKVTGHKIERKLGQNFFFYKRDLK